MGGVKEDEKPKKPGKGDRSKGGRGKGGRGKGDRGKGGRGNHGGRGNKNNNKPAADAGDNGGNAAAKADEKPQAPTGSVTSGNDTFSTSHLEQYLASLRSEGKATNAVKLGPTTVQAALPESQQPQRIKTESKPKTVLSLCDGMGGLALSLQMEGLLEGLQIDSYIAVEIDKEARARRG